MLDPFNIILERITSVNPIVISKESTVPTIVVVTMRNDGNAKKTWKGRGGGKGHNKAQGKGKARSTPKQDDPRTRSVCLFRLQRTTRMSTMPALMRKNISFAR